MTRPAAFLLAIVPFLLAAGPPEVVRLRVPADKVATVFPPGTDVRVMSQADFETLVKDAREGYERDAARRERPRPLRRRHAARWDRGVLVGTSEILIEGAKNPPSRALLDPWGPAIDASRTVLDALQVGPDRKLGVKVTGADPTTLVLGWEQAARPGSDGRGFDIELPALDASSFTLDLPADFVPDLGGMLRQGPSAGSANDRHSWRFDGAGGSVRLRLASPLGAGRDGPSCWVSGTTRVNVGESLANWHAEWLVEPIAGGSRRLEASLPLGLELVDVAGPAVASYRVQPASDGTNTLSIRLIDSAIGPSTVVVGAMARIPDEGAWRIPAAKPLHAAWTGGRTLVHLNPSLALGGCRLLAGRQVSPRADELEAEPRGGTLLAFEATSPDPVAELTLVRQTALASADVRGLLLLGREAPRIEARVTWRVDRGRLFQLAVDLSPGFTPERVQVQGADAPTAWHLEPRPDATSRLVIHITPGAEPLGPIVLELSAVAGEGGRVRPARPASRGRSHRRRRAGCRRGLAGEGRPGRDRVAHQCRRPGVDRSRDRERGRPVAAGIARHEARARLAMDRGRRPGRGEAVARGIGPRGRDLELREDLARSPDDRLVRRREPRRGRCTRAYRRHERAAGRENPLGNPRRIPQGGRGGGRPRETWPRSACRPGGRPGGSRPRARLAARR